MGQGAMGLETMGRRKVTLRLENYPVWMHDIIIQESGQGWVR